MRIKKHQCFFNICRVSIWTPSLLNHLKTVPQVFCNVPFLSFVLMGPQLTKPVWLKAKDGSHVPYEDFLLVAEEQWSCVGLWQSRVPASPNSLTELEQCHLWSKMQVFWMCFSDYKISDRSFCGNQDGKDSVNSALGNLRVLHLRLRKQSCSLCRRKKDERLKRCPLFAKASFCVRYFSPFQL